MAVNDEGADALAAIWAAVEMYGFCENVEVGEVSPVLFQLTNATCCRAVLIAVRSQALVFAVPHKFVPARMLKSRVGPLYRSVEAVTHLEKADPRGTPKSISVSLVLADPGVIHSFTLDDGTLEATAFDPQGGYPAAADVAQTAFEVYGDWLGYEEGDYATADDGQTRAVELPLRAHPSVEDERETTGGSFEDVVAGYEGGWEGDEMDGDAWRYEAPPPPAGAPLFAAAPKGAARGRGRGSAAAGRGAKRGGSAARAPAPLHATGNVGALDPTVVASARAAGIAEGDLQRFADILGARAPAHAATPPQAPAAKSLGKQKPSAPLHREVADTPGDVAADPLARMMTAMTDAFESFKKPETEEKRDPLMALFDSRGAPQPEGGASSSAGVSSRMGARGVALMKKAIVENPTSISDPVEDKVQAAFFGGATPPAGARASMRGYYEHRSALTDHQPTANWAWAVAGARDLLRAGKGDEALARLDLLCIAAEQVAMDRGSWVMARELLFAEDPPYHAWLGARPHDPLRQPHPSIADDRWCSIAEARLRELEDWRDRRNRLMRRPGPTGAAAVATEGLDGGDTTATPPRGRGGRRGRGRGGQPPQ